MKTAWKLKTLVEWMLGLSKLQLCLEKESGRQVSKQSLSKDMLPWSYGNGVNSLALPLLSELLHSPR